MAIEDDIAAASASWERAQILDTSPSWEGVPEHSAWVERFVESKESDIDRHLFDLASNQSNLIAAYAIQALFQRQSVLLSKLPVAVASRSGHITRQAGSFREKMQFKDFVRSTLRLLAKLEKPKQTE